MKLWKQVRKVKVDNLQFDFEDIDIEFDVKTTDTNDSDVASIKLYNLAETTKNKLKANQIVTIEAGYRELSGIIFAGIVESVTTIREDNDLVTLITASPNNRAYSNTIVNVQYKAGIKASEILSQVAKIIPFEIKVKGLGKDTTYPAGKAFSNRLNNVMEILAKDTKSKVNFTDKAIVFEIPGKVYSSLLELGSEQGLIKVEKKEEKADTKENKAEKEKKQKYVIESLLVPVVKVGQQLNIKSMLFTGKVVVKESNYVAKDLNQFTVIALCEVV